MPKIGNGVFEIDGMTFRLWVKELKRSFKVTDTDNSGRLKDYSMYRDIAGTFYNYTLTLDPDRSNRADYDSFYEIVSAPKASHHMVFSVMIVYLDSFREIGVGAKIWCQDILESTQLVHIPVWISP